MSAGNAWMSPHGSLSLAARRSAGRLTPSRNLARCFWSGSGVLLLSRRLDCPLGGDRASSPPCDNGYPARTQTWMDTAGNHNAPVGDRPPFGPVNRSAWSGLASSASPGPPVSIGAAWTLVVHLQRPDSYSQDNGTSTSYGLRHRWFHPLDQVGSFGSSITPTGQVWDSERLVG